MHLKAFIKNPNEVNEKIIMLLKNLSKGSQIKILIYNIFVKK